MKIGERIKIRRQELEWSQRELAAKMNYNHHSTLARIESGQVDVTQSRIVQFAEVLGVSVAYLMGWEENESDETTIQVTEGEQKLLDLFRKVPESQQQMVLQMITVALKSLE